MKNVVPAILSVAEPSSYSIAGGDDESTRFCHSYLAGKQNLNCLSGKFAQFPFRG
jgi:hypothetical protein